MANHRAILAGIIELARGDRLIGAYDKWHKAQGPKLRRQLTAIMGMGGHTPQKMVNATFKKDHRAMGKLIEESPNSQMVQETMKTLRDQTAKSTRADRSSGILKKKFTSMDELARHRMGGLSMSARESLASIIELATKRKRPIPIKKGMLRTQQAVPGDCAGSSSMLSVREQLDNIQFGLIPKDTRGWNTRAALAQAAAQRKISVWDAIKGIIKPTPERGSLGASAAAQAIKKLRSSKALSSIDQLDSILEFKIKIDPKNKGKFDTTKKKTGKSTEELEHSKNPKTRKRAVFAENAKHWHHGKKEMSARDKLIELKAMDLGETYPNYPRGSGLDSGKENRKHYPSLSIYDRENELDLPLSGTAKVRFKLRSKTIRQNEEGKKKHSAEIEIQSIDPFEEEVKPIEGGGAKPLKLSARRQLDLIMFGPDPRARNNLGEFSGGGEETPSPNAMHETYKSGLSNLGAGASFGTGAAVSGGAIQALMSKLKKAKA